MAKLVFIPGCEGCYNRCQFNGRVMIKEVAENQAKKDPYGCHSIYKWIARLKEEIEAKFGGR